MSFYTLIVIALTALVNQCIAGYALEDDYSADNFFSMFEFFTAPDPTSGFVSYVDQGTAEAAGLVSTNGSSVYMGVDHTNVVSTGRNSVRLTSHKAYNQGLIVLDVAHMPEGCGTWPAFWMTGPDWPSNGEIDIIEGVNQQAENAMTLHTGPGCSISDNGAFTGAIQTWSCDVDAAGQATNAGCSIDAPNSNTYGSGFNAVNGGVYATEWTSDAISIYFFPRSSIPSDISSGNPDPSGWGKPLAQFQGGCDIESTFQNQQIVFDTTFCGDWAGNVWSSGSCASQASSCEAFVANNPSAFEDAYWEVNSLRVYQSSNSDTPNPPETSVGSGPTGIASSIASAASSLAPIPVSTQNIQTTFAVSAKPTSSAPSSVQTSSEATSSILSTSSLAAVQPGALEHATSTASPTASSRPQSATDSEAASTTSSASTAASVVSSLSQPSAISKAASTSGTSATAPGTSSLTESFASSTAAVEPAAPTPATSQAASVSPSLSPPSAASKAAVEPDASALTTSTALTPSTALSAADLPATSLAAVDPGALAPANSKIASGTHHSSSVASSAVHSAVVTSAAVVVKTTTVPGTTVVPLVALTTTTIPAPAVATTGTVPSAADFANWAGQEVEEGGGAWTVEWEQNKRDTDNVTQLEKEDFKEDALEPALYPSGRLARADASADIRRKEKRRMHARRHLDRHARRSGHI